MLGSAGARCRQTLFSWDSGVHDRRDHAIHVIFVAQQTVLPRHAAGVTGLAEVLFHRTEIGHEILRIALLIALQKGAVFFKAMTGQAAAILQDAEMRLMDEIREASLFRLDLGRGEIDQPASALDVVNAVTFRA
jgi:hypothetical protein